MTTIDTRDLKVTLKNMGVRVLRTLTYKGGVIITVNAESVSVCENYFESKNICCVRPMNAPKKAKANVLGYAGAAEFTSLYQL